MADDTKVADDVVLKQYIPYAQYEIVDVQFGNAYEDLEIRHSLQPPTPEHIDYSILRQAQAATIYHDLTGTRKPWRDGVITLRSNVANSRVTLLLTVSHEKRELPGTTPATVTPPIGTHTHDAADVVSGTLDPARIPNLDAAKITTGTFGKTFLTSAIAYEDEANIFSQNQLISKNQPEVLFRHASSNAKGRFAQYLANYMVMSRNLAFDGTNWNLDDTSADGALIYSTASSGLVVAVATAGANPRTPSTVFDVNSAGVVNTLGQIKFPATQNPSADVNTLDDYEEGTWTPTLTFGGAATGMTYTTRTGIYTKVGNVVYCEFRIQLSAKGSSTGSAAITGLPFSAAGLPMGFIDPSAGMSGLTGAPAGVISVATIFPVITSATGRASMTDANFSNTSDIRMGFSYTV